MLPEHNPVFLARSKSLSKVQRVVEGYVQEWLGRLGLETWRGVVDYNATYSEKGPEILAMIQPQWEYQQYFLNIYLPTLTHKDPDEMEFLVVHELVHCLVNPMSRLGRKPHREELAVTQIAKALLRTKYNAFVPSLPRKKAVKPKK